MIIVRIAEGDRPPQYGRVADGWIELLDGAPWLHGATIGRRVRLDEVTQLAPVAPSKIVCVGKNYRDHIEEMGFELPSEPSVFLKPTTALLAPNGAVVLPPSSISSVVEHEAELTVVIGRTAQRVPEQEALDHVFGYTLANDVSARDLQRAGHTLMRAKGWDTFCPMGPHIQTELDLDAGVRVTCRVNGVLRQDGNTTSLLFSIPQIISYVSRFMTLHPGDVVLTGSPGGSGPLRPGDRVDVSAAGIGTLVHGVQAAPAETVTA